MLTEDHFIGLKHRFHLDEYYDIFQNQIYHKYLVATSTENVYSLSEIMDKHWSQIELPFESVSVHLGYRFLFFHTTQGEIVVSSNFEGKESCSAFLVESKKPSPPFHILNLIKIIDHCYDHYDLNSNTKTYHLKRTLCDSSSIYLELTNGLLIRFQVTTSQSSPFQVFTQYISDRIKFISSSTQSKRICIVTESNQIHDYLEGSLNDNVRLGNDKNIIMLANSPLATVVVTEDNVLHIRGQDSNGCCGGWTDGTKFGVPMSFTEKIVDVQCGYIHTVVLLEDGSVYTTGYNDLKQCGRLSDTHKFDRMSIPLITKNKVKKLACTSRGTVLITGMYPKKVI